MPAGVKRWIWTAVVMAVLVAGLIGIAYRYGPICELGEERCNGRVLEQCAPREARRDPGRQWIEVTTCRGACVEDGRHASCE